MIHAKLYELILDVIESKLSKASFDRNTIQPETSLMEILDSFGILDTLIEIEGRTGINADLGQMDFEKAMTLGGLAEEIIRINPTVKFNG